ncbi:MAG TPA: NrsF family protein [Polyangiaceae bacterium]|nr:NrsF family protein [Polyangiaceae bacterium]
MPLQPSSELRARVLLAASREDAPTRDRVKRRDSWLLLSAVVVPLLVFFAFGGLRDGPRPTLLVLRTSLGAGAIALVCLLVGLSRGRSTLGRARVWLWCLALLAPVALFGWKVAVSSQFERMMVLWPGRIGLRCLSLHCLMALWPLTALVLTRRESDPVHPALTGAAIGAAIGASLWVFVDLSCPVAYVPHLLLGHVLPLLLTTSVGAVLGERFIALRAHR